MRRDADERQRLAMLVDGNKQPTADERLLAA
jgi:hypothetical protein